MPPFRFTTPVFFRACAVLLTLLCARAHAQAEPTSVTIVGTFQSELGCPGDWDPACGNTGLERNAVDGVWRKLFTVPGGPQEFKAALNGSWEENYGANAQRDGANLFFSHTEDFIGVKFFYDPVTHWVTSSSITPIAVLAGSLQSELGCPGDWDPACMRTWLKDIDGDGVQELRVPSLPAGTYELKVAHHESWEENYGLYGVRDGANIPFTVPADGQAIRFTYDAWSHLLTINVAAPTTTTLSVSPNPSSPDEDVTLTAIVALTGGTSIPTGTVTFKVEGQALGTAPVGPNGVATLTAPAFPSGTAALTAEYTGNFESSLSLPVILQTGYRTTTTLTVTPGSATAYGEQVTLEATVMREAPGTGSARGDVFFQSGDTVLGFAQVDDSGHATLSLTTLGVGVHALTARFAPQAPFLASLGGASHTVNRTATEVFLGSDGSPRPLGLPITFQAVVQHGGIAPRPPSGSVTFQAVAGGITQELGSSSLDAQGEASVVVSGLPMHTYAVTATYSGDDVFQPATSAVFTQVVTFAQTRTVVTVSPPASVYGQPVDIQAEVRPELAMEQTPSGRVRVQTNNPNEPWLEATLTLDAAGRASLRTPLPEPGEYAVSANYEGGGVFGGSLSAPFVVTVRRGASQVVLGSSRIQSDSGQAVTFIALVAAAPPAAGTPGGSMTFLDGTTALATVPVNAQGAASHTTATLTPGEHGITAAYSGDTRFEPNTSAVVLQVVRAPEPPDAGPGDQDGGSAPDAGPSTDGGPGESDAGTGDVDAGDGDTDAGSAPDAGSGDTDAGTGHEDAGSAPDAGGGNTDAGPGTTDAGTSDTDAGTGNADAGPGDTDAGTGNTDAGTGNTDAGAGDTDAGTGNTDAGTTPGNDAGTQGPDAGTGTGNDAGTSDEPGDETASGCGCGAGSGGGSPLLMLGMWMGLTAIQSRRRASRQARR